MGLTFVDLQAAQAEDLSVLRHLATIPSDWCLELNLEHNELLLPDQQQDSAAYEGAVDVQVRKLQAMAALLGSCRNVTRLELSTSFDAPDVVVADKVAWGRQVAKLEKLRSLTLNLQVGAVVDGLLVGCNSPAAASVQHGLHSVQHRLAVRVTWEL
jgi:hypothetical protein